MIYFFYGEKIKYELRLGNFLIEVKNKIYKIFVLIYLNYF